MRLKTVKSKYLDIAVMNHLTRKKVGAFAKESSRRLQSVLLFTFITAFSLTSCSTKNKNETNTYKDKQQNTIDMKKVLIIGMDPHTIDFSNPEIPQGLTVEKIEQGAKATVEKLNTMGYDANLFLIETGTSDLSRLENHFNQKSYDGIVIGNGIRSIQTNFILFEQIVNVVHTHAPKAKIIFNSLPTDTDEAVKRWL